MYHRNGFVHCLRFAGWLAVWLAGWLIRNSSKVEGDSVLILHPDYSIQDTFFQAVNWPFRICFHSFGHAPGFFWLDVSLWVSRLAVLSTDLQEV